MSVIARGGYQIVDFDGILFEVSTEEDPKPITIPGIFAKIGELYPVKKPILVCNLKYTDGIEHTIIPQFAHDFIADEEQIEISVGSYAIDLMTDDSVYFLILEGK